MRTALLAVAFLSLVGSCAVAQLNTDNHVVTVTVGEAAWLGLSDPIGGPIDINIVLAPGTNATDATTRMDWGTNGVGYDITVEEQLVNDGGDGSIDYLLQVTPINIVRVGGTNAGTAVGTVTLDGVAGAKPFINGVDAAVAFCTLQYYAEADALDLPGTESRTVVYTILQ